MLWFFFKLYDINFLTQCLIKFKSSEITNNVFFCGLMKLKNENESIACIRKLYLLSRGILHSTLGPMSMCSEMVRNNKLKK